MAEHFFFFFILYCSEQSAGTFAGKNKIIILGGISMAVLEVSSEKICKPRLGSARVQALTEVIQIFSWKKGDMWRSSESEVRKNHTP